MVHFIIEAVETLDIQGFSVNERCSGSPQYPPSMMLALLVYCYATGRFSSREIEQLTRKAEAADSVPLDTGLDLPEEGKTPRGREPEPPSGNPPENAQFNFTDSENRIMKAGNGEHGKQAYNAQAVINTEDSMCSWDSM